MSREIPGESVSAVYDRTVRVIFDYPDYGALLGKSCPTGRKIHRRPLSTQCTYIALSRSEGGANCTRVRGSGPFDRVHQDMEPVITLGR